MQNKIENLRDHLFATIEALRDKEAPMEVDRARAIAEVAQVIVNTAKVEIHHIDLFGGKGTGFIERAEIAPPAPRPRLIGKIG